MRLRTGNRRRRRAFWRGRGHVHLRSGHGIWLRDDLYGEAYRGIGLMASGEETVRYYRVYP